MELTDFLGYLGTIISFVFSVSTIPGIIQNGSTKSFDKIPIVYMVFNVLTQGLWLIYSLMIENELLIYTNLMCYGLALLNVAIYYYYLSKLPIMAVVYSVMAIFVYIVVISLFS